MQENKSSNPIVNIPELLAPAGNYEKLVTAVHYGADAVYLGGEQFSLRAKAGNFDEEWMRAGVEHAHSAGVKVYVTVNIFAHNQDFSRLPEYLQMLKAIGVDGVIVSDPGILRYVRKYIPEMPLHLSTQANVTNAQSAIFWFEQGVSRLNLARELSLTEISEIRKQSKGELEVFVHGALCISYSGRCMLSNYMTGRDANQGNCAHPCRFSYALVEEKRPGEYFPVEEDERGTYIFNSKDLCLLNTLPELVAAGVDSLKIEGRMKSIFYVGGVVRVYRAALDYLRRLPGEAWEKPEQIRMPEILDSEIRRTGTRGNTENFIRNRPGSSEMIYTSSRAVQTFEPVAVVRGVGEKLQVDVRNTLQLDDMVEYMHRSLDVTEHKITAIWSGDGEALDRAHPGTSVELTVQPSLPNCAVHGIFRREKASR